MQQCKMHVTDVACHIQLLLSELTSVHMSRLLSGVAPMGVPHDSNTLLLSFLLAVQSVTTTCHSAVVT